MKSEEEIIKRIDLIQSMINEDHLSMAAINDGISRISALKWVLEEGVA